MSESQGAGLDRGSADLMSALFAQLIMQQANMAFMLLGKVAHPESGRVVKDVEAAKLFIDQLEMLETKTKGNLTKEESDLLKRSLMTLRLAFVEAVEEPEKKPEAQPSPPAKSEAAPTEGTSPSSPETEEEHRKKFSKKY